MLTKRFGIAAMLALVGAAYGCKTTTDQQPTSETVEAADPRNGPELFGAEPVTYDHISQEAFQQGTFAHVPWTDTYWPLYQAGFAARWIDTSEAPPFELQADVESANYEDDVQAEIAAAMEGVQQLSESDWQQTIAISPAEKYDIGVGDANFVSFKYYKECRDLNASSFHTVLARFLADGLGEQPKRSFVLDITRDDQV